MLYPEPPGTPPDGMIWHPALGRYVPIGHRQPVRAPGSPAPGPNDVAVPRSPQDAPQYLPDVGNGMLGMGGGKGAAPTYIPITTTKEVALPYNSAQEMLMAMFQDRSGGFRWTPGSANSILPGIDPAALKLFGGGLAYGALDPSWGKMFQNITTFQQLLPAKKKQKQSTPPPEEQKIPRAGVGNPPRTPGQERGPRGKPEM